MNTTILQQVKEQVAHKHGYKNWVSLQICVTHPIEVEKVYDELLETYMKEYEQVLTSEA